MLTRGFFRSGKAESTRVTALLIGAGIVLQLTALRASAQGVNYDLTSSQSSATHLAGDVSIDVGGSMVTVQHGSLLTPAEQVAVNQVLGAGQQAILLSAQGTAVGGVVNLSTDLGAGVHHLVIPQGVTALGNFSNQSSISISGNLVNSGNLYAYSSNAAATVALISAANITNQQGGVISSVLPSKLSTSLGAISQLNLSLYAVQNIVNSGIISSSGNLSITAGGSVVNSSASAVSALMQAAANVNLTAANIINPVR